MNGILNIQVQVLSQQALAQLRQLEKEIAAVDKALGAEASASNRLSVAQEHNINTKAKLIKANRELSASSRAATAADKAMASSTAAVARAEEALTKATLRETQARRARDAIGVNKLAAENAAINATIHASERLDKALRAATKAQLEYDAAFEAARAEDSTANLNKLTVALDRVKNAEIEVARAVRYRAEQSAFSATQAAKAVGASNALAKAEETLAAAERAVALANTELAAASAAVSAAETEQSATAQRLALAEREAAAADEQATVAAVALANARRDAAAATAAESAAAKASALAAKESAAIQKAAAAESAAATKLSATSAVAAGAGFAAATNSMRKFGSQTQWAGRQLTTNFTMPVLLIGGLATKFALENEQAMTRVKKVYGELGMELNKKNAELAALGKAFEMLSNHFGVNQKEVLNIAADWAAAGAAGRGLAEGVKATLQTMILGEIDAAQATKALIAIQSQYRLSTKELSDVIGQLNVVENQTGASLSDLITGFSRTAGMARLVGVDTKHLAAMIAGLTPAAGSAANAGNALKTIFTRLVSPTKEARQILNEVGLTMDDMSWKNSNAVEKLEAINKKFNELPKAQKGVVASTLAGTYQVSRFAELMSAMTPTVDKAKNGLTQYEKAMEATSNQTAYMKQKETELQTVLQSNPQKMKQVWVVLQNTLARAIIPAIPTIIMLAGAIQKLFDWFNSLPPYVRKAAIAFVLFAAIMGPILRIVGSFILLGGYIGKIFLAIGKSARALGVVFRFVFGRALMAVVGAIGAVPLAIIAAVAVIVAALMTIPGFTEKVTAAIKHVFDMLPASVQGALMAVVRIVKAAVMAVYQLFSYLNPFAHHSPSLVENVQKGMAIVRDEFASITSIGPPIMKAYADIQKFVKATAELRKGLDSMQRAQDLSELMKLAPGAADEFRALVKDLQTLTPIMERLEASMKKQQAIVDQWEKKLRAANLALDVQQGKLQDLQDVADGYSKLLSAANDDLDRFASAPLVGMRAMEDQIFANEMAQKALRLEMMNLQDVNGPMDDLAARMAALAGQIEYLKGEQTDLRSAGAGSDILGFYDQQIAALEDQQNTIGNTTTEYNDLQHQLEVLQRQADRMDLEKSLNFDGLIRSIDQAAHGMAEMPFDQIMAGISGVKDHIDQYTLALAAANANVADQQQKVDAAQQKVDAINKSYDAQRDKLDEITDRYNKVKDAVDAVTSSLSDMISAVTAANQAGVKKKGSGEYVSNALQNFRDAAGGDFADVGGTSGLGREGGLKEINDFIAELEAETATLGDKIDLFKPIRTKWAEFKNWWNVSVVGGLDKLLSPVGDAFEKFGSNPKTQQAFASFGHGAMTALEDVGKVLESLWKLFGDDVMDRLAMGVDKAREAWKKISPEVVKFKDLLKPMWDALKNVWIAIEIVAVVIGVLLSPIIAAFLLALKVTASTLTNVMGPALTFIIEAVKNFLQFLRGMIEFITGVLTGDWRLAWQGIKDIFASQFNEMLNIITSIGAIIWGAIKGFVEGIRDFFVWLWDVLVGHSIIPDMVNAIVSWFTGMPGRIMAGLAALGGQLVALIQAAWALFMSALKTAWQGTYNFITGLPQKIYDGFMAYANLLISVGTKIVGLWLQGFTGAWSTVGTWIADKVTWIVNKLGGLKDSLAGKFDGMFDGIVNAFKWAMNFVIRGWNNLNFHIPGFHIGPVGYDGFDVGVTKIPELRAAGGAVTKGLPYVVGEIGPEFFIPGANGRIVSNSDIASLMSAAVKDSISTLQSTPLSDAVKVVNAGALGATVARSATGAAGGDQPVQSVQNQTVNNTTEYHFHGDLSFPNITSGEDAEQFLTNLSDLAG